MSDYKMNYLPDDDDSQQQMEDSEREEYEREYEEWLDSIDKKGSSDLSNTNKERGLREGEPKDA